MSTIAHGYVGVVTGPTGPLGAIRITLTPINVNGVRRVTGNVQVGEGSRRGLTGFSGTWTVDGNVQADGGQRSTNAVDNPLDDVMLSVKVTGRAVGDGIAGEIAADVNGNPASWTYEAWDIAGERGQSLVNKPASGPLGAALELAEKAGGQVKSYWDMVPDAGKLAGAAAAIYAGWRFFKR